MADIMSREEFQILLVHMRHDPFCDKCQEILAEFDRLNSELARWQNLADEEYKRRIEEEDANKELKGWLDRISEPLDKARRLGDANWAITKDEIIDRVWDYLDSLEKPSEKHHVKDCSRHMCWIDGYWIPTRDCPICNPRRRTLEFELPDELEGKEIISGKLHLGSLTILAKEDLIHKYFR